MTQKLKKIFNFPKTTDFFLFRMIKNDSLF